MRKEEEAARLALALASLEHLVAVRFCRERSLYYCLVNAIHVADLLELFGSILIDLHSFVDEDEVIDLLLEHGLRSVRVNGAAADSRLPFRQLLVFSNVLIRIVVIQLSLVPLFRVLDLDSVKDKHSNEFEFLVPPVDRVRRRRSPHILVTRPTTS